MKARTVELKIKKGWVSEGWQKEFESFAGFIHNVARVEETKICTFFFDGNNNLVGTFASNVISHDFPAEGQELASIKPTAICTYCKEPLTSDDFKVDECTTMHKHCKIHLEDDQFVEDVRENHPDLMEGFRTNLDNFYGDKS